jgi:antirestriction protein ArdC
VLEDALSEAEVVASAEAVLETSGIEIRYDQTDDAFYRAATDCVNLRTR